MHHPLSCLPWGSELHVSHYPHSRAAYDEQYVKIFKLRNHEKYYKFQQ
jgi:hypothetical protein